MSIREKYIAGVLITACNTLAVEQVRIDGNSHEKLIAVIGTVFFLFLVLAIYRSIQKTEGECHGA